MSILSKFILPIASKEKCVMKIQMMYNSIRKNVMNFNQMYIKRFHAKE